MKRPRFDEMERRCQKPDHRTVGNWFARNVSRPLALRITWIILPLGISAHAMTLLAWVCAAGAALSLGSGAANGWLLGATLLHLWYLLDHVDGQLARWSGTASLGGVQLDYLMHHAVNVMVPVGAGYGASVSAEEPALMLAGAAWGVSALVLGLIHDTRQKAFEQRLKRVYGELRVIGGGGGRPTPPPGPPRTIRGFIKWSARKSCETQSVLLMVPLVSFCMLAGWPADRFYVSGMAAISTAVAAIAVMREVKHHRAETTFANWFQPPIGHDLTFDGGWWRVTPSQNGGNKSAGAAGDGRSS